MGHPGHGTTIPSPAPYWGALCCWFSRGGGLAFCHGLAHFAHLGLNGEIPRETSPTWMDVTVLTPAAELMGICLLGTQQK